MSPLFILVAVGALSQQSVPPAHTLPKALEPLGRPLQKVVFAERKSANIWFSLQGMTITLSWGWAPPNVPDVGQKQVHAVPYRPSATQVLPGTTSFYVAGVGAGAGPGGSTLIERWDLGPPTTKAIRKWNGDYEYIVIPGPILSRTTVFSDPNATEGGVNYFLVNHGEPGTLLLQFINSRNVYKLDSATGALSLALDGALFPDTLQPGFVDMLELDNPDKGFVYVLIEDRFPTEGNMPLLCVLIDAARTGVLGELRVLTFEQYQTQGFNQGTPLNSHISWPHWM